MHLDVCRSWPPVIACSFTEQLTCVTFQGSSSMSAPAQQSGDDHTAPVRPKGVVIYATSCVAMQVSICMCITMLQYRAHVSCLIMGALLMLFIVCNCMWTQPGSIFLLGVRGVSPRRRRFHRPGHGILSWPTCAARRGTGSNMDLSQTHCPNEKVRGNNFLAMW